MTDPVWPPDLLDSPHEVRDKAARIRRMFDAIAPRYALVNTVCSAGRDARWRRVAVELADPREDDDVLDIACGTGDFARVFARAGPRRIIGLDFSREMLSRAQRAGEADVAGRSHPAPRTSAGHRGTPLHWVQADALRLPFPDAAFSVVSCAFGVRNFADLDAALAEMRRVLRPRGRAIILEFSRPRHPLARRIYEFYTGRVMPVAAAWISGDRTGAYRYLPRSVVSFLSARQMTDRLLRAGFVRATARPLTFGVVTVYRADRE